MVQKEYEVIGTGRFCRFVVRNGWEYLERLRVRGIVCILAVTPDEKVVLTEQFRPALYRTVLELPAGLVGDDPGMENESFESAAQRELLEETGWHATEFKRIGLFPTSTGLTSEQVVLYSTRALEKKHEGGGVGDEMITAHEVPLAEIDGWIARQNASGRLVDPKVYAGLYFLQDQGGKCI